MSEDWGPWIEHSGGHCPCAGLVQVVMLDGDTDEADASEFEWGHRNLGSFFPGYIIRYRIRKPRGLTIPEGLLENLPEEVDA